ncbi:glycosyltransferase family 2 protein [Nocardia terpenica]|uniref:Glycosyl transferase n=1 Tax=Nocardia terpenica TaxID=455432 RepID=A0A291RXZ4_9NOCA|nr:glycosyltransferase family A protein [Nocardia terpenica]ATL72185.1 glycosyl transferase [Nocardia terpenica]
MRVEIVTAVHGAYAHFLPAAWKSLLAQTYSDWRWLVQIDGPVRDVTPTLIACGAADDPRVGVAVNGTREGPAVTRNVALGRASAPVIQNLDADDELEPTALETLTAALRAHPGAGFAVGPARDLLYSGELVEFPLPFPAGLVPRGALVDAWITEPGAYRLPVHPAGVMWRRGLLLALGGWAGLRDMEDTALLMSASALAPCAAVDTVTLRYRKHRTQRSAQTSLFEGGGDQISLIRQRAKALRAGPGWVLDPAPV